MVGISFHVGSGCRDAFIFDKAIRSARTLFDFGNSLGFQMNVLDLGGGFPGTDNAAMEKVLYTLFITISGAKRGSRYGHYCSGPSWGNGLYRFEEIKLIYS